jgi:CO/xanthine dehydrogenase Mo-binding subunit
MSIGVPHHRIDALDKVTGAARFPADIRRDDALVARVVFTDRPHARLVSLDTTTALSIQGVVEVVTAADIPVNEYGLTMFDQPVLIGVDHTGRSPVPCDISRWEADHLAVVVAETEEAARAGAAALRVEWQELPILGDIDTALADDAPVLHPEKGKDSNAYYHLKIRKGDIDAGWAAADVVVEGTYDLPHQEHAYLQPEAATAYLDDEDRITVEIGGQWTYEDLGQICHALDLPEEDVRVVYPAVGGAFGGREDMSLQIVLAAAVMKLRARGVRRPVRSVWSREESIVGHHKRHRARVHARLGATRDGKITAVEIDGYMDAGAYNYTTNKVLGNMHLCVAGPYEVPNARIDSIAVYTNTVPGGAFRGFGAPQGAFVAESQMNKLAEALDMDPVELRLENALQEGSRGITQAELPAGVSISEVIEAAARQAAAPFQPVPVPSFASLPPDESRIRRGRGFACAYKNVGFSFGFPERCDATVVLHGEGDRIDWVELFHGAAEVGQGSHTALVQMTAEAVGVDTDQVRASFSDTATSGDSGSVSASRMTWMAGNSILGAVEEASKRWMEGDRPAVGEFRFTPPPTEALDPEDGTGQPNFAYGYVAEVVDVSVDVDTGQVRIDRVVCADDVGRAINPVLVIGQIEGAIVQATGYTISEDLQLRDGRITNPRLSGYLIPGIGDIPGRVDPVIVEHADPRGPWGVRGMAEMPFIPLAPAVVAAIHDATGVWIDGLPLTPSRVLAALRAADR